MINLLGIGLDYLMLKDDKVRGDVRLRQFDYAKCLESLHLVIYAPKELQLKPKQWTNNLWVYPTNSKNKITFIFDALHIASKICKERKINAITTEDPFTTGLVGYLLKKKFGIPLNVQAHIDFFDNQYWIQLRKVNWLFNKLAKFICKRADTIRVVASETKNSLVAYGIPSENIKLISVHSDLSHFNSVDGLKIRQNFLNKGFEKILIFVGRLVDQKDIPNLFNAFEIILKNNPKTLLLLIGKGPKMEFLEKLSRDKKIDHNVIFTGTISHAEIVNYYAASDIFVLPSIFEGRATVIVEALLAKKPIVATDVSGLREWLIDGETGFIVKRKDFHAFADKACFLLDNPKIAESFGEKGYEIAQKNIGEISDTTSMIKLWEQTAQAVKS